MKRLTKRILGITLLTLLILAAGALLSLNLFLRSPGVKERVAAAFQGRTALPCSVDSISYLPFQGIKLSGFTIPQSPALSALTKAPFLRADAVVAKVPIWSLIRRPIRLEEVRCVRPSIVSVQLDNGSMGLPWPKRPLVVRPPELAANPPSSSPLSDVVAPAPSIPERPSGTLETVVQVTGSEDRALSEPGVTIESPPSTVVEERPSDDPLRPDPNKTAASSKSTVPDLLWIKAARVQEGRLVVLAADGQLPLLEFDNITIELGFDQPWKRRQRLPQPTGNLKINSVRAVKALHMVDFHSPIEFKEGQLILPDIVATSDGGNLEGRFALGLRGQGLPFKAALSMKDIDLRGVIKRVSSRINFSSGTIEGQMVAQGRLTDPSTWRGAGEVLGLDAKITRHGLLESFGRYLGVKEFVQIAFDTARTEFELRGSALVFRDIHLKTDNLEFKGLGVVSLNQRLQLRARLYFSERMKRVLQRIERQLPERVKRDFEQLEGRDDYFRDFLINGSVSSPRADFIGTQERSLEEMLELIQSQKERKDGA